MTLLPLSTFIFSLLAGNLDMGEPSSNVRGELFSRYKSSPIEETQEQEHEETVEAPEDLG